MAIRLLIVDDSAFMRKQIREIVEADGGFAVVGQARDGAEAIVQARTLKPDLITLDLNMPIMTGLAAIPRIMMETQTRIVVLAAFANDDQTQLLECLNLGAVEVIPKPSGEVSLDLKVYAADFCRQLREAMVARLARQRFRVPVRTATTVPLPDGVADIVLAIGASTGGPKAVSEVIAGLPRDLAAAVVVVQHMPPSFFTPFTQRLNGLGSLPFQETQGGMVLKRGHGYVATGGIHWTLVNRDQGGWSFRSTTHPDEHPHKPSVDVLFHAVASKVGSRSVAALLTGMGNDGASGMRAIRDAGGQTLAEDESTCIVFGMPAQAIALGGATHVLPLPEISAQLQELVRALARQRPTVQS